MKKDRLLQAYTLTQYEVQGLSEALHVGLHDVRTDAFLLKHGATCAAVLSAYNPFCLPSSSSARGPVSQK